MHLGKLVKWTLEAWKCAHSVFTALTKRIALVVCLEEVTHAQPAT